MCCQRGTWDTDGTWTSLARSKSSLAEEKSCCVYGCCHGSKYPHPEWSFSSSFSFFPWESSTLWIFLSKPATPSPEPSLLLRAPPWGYWWERDGIIDITHAPKNCISKLFGFTGFKSSRAQRGDWRTAALGSELAIQGRTCFSDRRTHLKLYRQNYSFTDKNSPLL